ncbi:hypothetical protein [Frankia sp. AgKG'84/4]
MVEVREPGPSRAAPSTAPVVLGVLLPALIAVLPVILRGLPLIAAAGTAALLLSPRTILRSGRSARRGDLRSRENLQTTVFQLRIFRAAGSRPDDESDSGVEEEVDCRLIRRTAASTPLLIGGELVSGWGRYDSRRKLIEIRELVTVSPPARHRASRHVSVVPGIAVLVVGATLAAALFHLLRDRVRAEAAGQIRWTALAVFLAIVFAVAYRLVRGRRRRKAAAPSRAGGRRAGRRAGRR